MADLWRQVRAQVELENYLVNLPREHISLDDAEQLLVRLRVMSEAIRRGDNINLEIMGRHEALRRQVININSLIVPQLVISDFNQRYGVYAEERRTILRMDPETVSRRERQDYIKWYRQLNDYMACEPRVDLTARSMHRWLAVALIRLRCERDDYGLSPRERADLSDHRETMIQLLEDDLLNGDLPLSEHGATREVLLDLLASSYAETGTLGRDARQRPERARTPPTLIVEDGGLNFEALELSPIDFDYLGNLTGHVPPQPASTQDRTDAILVLFPSVPLESLPATHRTCHICQDEYGTPVEGGEACLPRRATCCEPNTFGGICLVKWFLEDNGPKLCPICRHDWRDQIRELANALAG